MRLASVEIRDFRSIYVDDNNQPMRLELASGSNTLVGQNNCGKSNVLRAVALALDPHRIYDPGLDQPGPRPFGHPIITLTFAGDPAAKEDAAAFAAADAYEASLVGRAGASRASAGEIALRVSFVPGEHGVTRVEEIVGRGEGRPSSDDRSSVLLRKAIDELRSSVRFVLISSGESIESVLEGNFREILHSVVRDRLRKEFEGAERSRKEYVDGLQESLLRPLRERLATDVHGLFPEIDAIGLWPEVSSIEQTLSNVGVMLEDVVSTPLSGKGTGVRGGVLVAMLSYLAINATRSMVFAVEEPEAFLHPGAQEDLREHLEKVGAASSVSLLVTTHSPFLMTRSPAGKIFCLAKDVDGRTRVSGSAAGDADHAPLLGDLLREETIETLLKASSVFPDGSEAVVLVEGEGDKRCLELAAACIGRPDLLAGLVIRPAGGTIKLVAQAVITKAATELPIVVVVDNDEPGKLAKDKLVGNTFGFDKKQFLTYAVAFEDDDLKAQWRSFDVEAEDLFSVSLMESFVAAHGQSILTGTKLRPDGAWHYDMNESAKELLDEWIHTEAKPDDLVRWVTMLLRIRQAAKLVVPDESVQELVATAAAADVPEPSSQGDVEGRVLIVVGQHDHARYLSEGAIVLSDGVDTAAEFTHVGFYAKSILEHVPAVVADHPNLLLSGTTTEQLRETGKEADLRLAQFIDRVIWENRDLAGTSARVLLLSEPESDRTINLVQPIRNTKRLSNKPVAWTIGPRVVPLSALLAGVETTDELDRRIETPEETP